MSYSPRLPAACHILLTMGLALSIGLWPHAASATQWLSIKKTDVSQLLIDKQSLLEEKPYIKAWVKVEYHTPQKNPESVDRVYTHAKALWYFDCDKRKAATIQVFQYEQDELVYAAGTTAKQADFIEPLPDSEVEITQQYVCKWQNKQKQLAEARTQRASSPVIPAVATDKDLAAPPVPPDSLPTNTPAPATPENKPAAAVTSPQRAKAQQPAPAVKAAPTKKPAEEGQAAAPPQKTTATDKPAVAQKKPWAYQGEQGPAHWSTLEPQYAMCQQGRQQSPIDINDTITAALKPLKRLQKFPLKSIVRKDYGLLVDAGSGNMMVLDQKPYQLKYISLHTPAEHQIKQHSYAAEMQMVHEDKTGHRVILSVMFETGAAHPALEKLLGSLPNSNTPQTLAFRITPAELMPTRPAYYRYTGSMTTPPCSEGVQWILMKETLKLSISQLQALQHAIGGDNARPLQDNQGRMVLE